MISVIIPTFRPKYLREVLTALRSQITNYPFEVIVVENPESTEAVQTLVHNYGFRYETSILGANNARHHGISVAQYGLIALIDDDVIPNKHWVQQMVSLNETNKAYSVFGGSLDLEYRATPPKWVTGPFEQMLSRLRWDAQYPRRLNEGEYVVSGNMFFRKETYNAVNGLNLEAGYMGRDWKPNDEVEFVEKCKEIGPVFYAPELKANHQIDETRLSLNFFRQRFYGQGWADGKLYLRQHHRKPINDIYHDHIQPKLILAETIVIYSVREKLCNEDLTREFIKNYLICKTDYMCAFQSAILECKLWEPILI